MNRRWRPEVLLSVLTVWAMAGCGPVGGSLPETRTGDFPILKEVRPLSPVSIRLEWVDRSQGEEGFVIERRTGQDSFSFRDNVGPNETTYEDNGLLAGTTYFYRVYYTKGAERSKASNEEQATTFSQQALLTESSVRPRMMIR